ncbi:MAG: AraC family transcriptional regulator [Treponema sp.]|nr:AraC family transcriptional regulator [Treponema sp.]
MDWITKLNEAVSYIEDNLTGSVDCGKAAEIAECSAYHFQRMFTYLADTSLSEYIRRRKMSLAATDLQHGDKVLDVALRYGYESPTAFNRAFKAVHGIAPSAVKKQGSLIKAFPRVSFTVAVTGGTELSYFIAKKESFRIAGISIELDNNLEKNFAKVPRMWMKAALLGTVKKIASLQNNPSLPGILGVSIPESDDKWSYYIASATDKDTEHKFSSRIIPAFTWAVFPGEGTNRDIQLLEKRIVTEWLPSSGYEYDNGPDVEVYLTPDPKHAKYEVWIPVVKKQKMQ